MAGDTNSSRDVFWRDRQTGTTRIASVSDGGAQVSGGFPRAQKSLTADGQRVLFAHPADGLVPADTNGVLDLFIRDFQRNRTLLANRNAAGAIVTPGLGWDLTQDGRLVGFRNGSGALLLVPAR